MNSSLGPEVGWVSPHPPGALVTPAPSTQVRPGCTLPAPPVNSPQLPGQTGRSAPGGLFGWRGVSVWLWGQGGVLSFHRNPLLPSRGCPQKPGTGCVGQACTQAAWGPALSRPRSPSADELLKPSVLQHMGPNCRSAHGLVALSLSLEGHFQSRAKMGPDEGPPSLG